LVKKFITINLLNIILYNSLIIHNIQLVGIKKVYKRLNYNINYDKSHFRITPPWGLDRDNGQ